MAKILITDGIDKSAANELAALGHDVIEQSCTPDELIPIVKEIDAIVVRSATKITREIIESALETKRLKLIIRGGVGIDNIDSRYAEANGISVVNTPEASSLAVAELTIGHMFALARYIYISNVSMREGKWDKKKYKGTELGGKTLGLIGFGRIARETARLASAIGMKVVYNTRSGKKSGFDGFDFLTMEELLAVSDFISLHVPFDEERGAVVGSKEFEMMKDGVFIINCARGGVLDEEALLSYLDSGKVAAAALDVYEQEPVKNEKLYTHGRICLTPHIGASTREAQARIGNEVVEIIKNRY